MVVCQESEVWAAYAASPKVNPSDMNRLTKTKMSGVPLKYGSSTAPIVQVAPFCRRVPTHEWFAERMVCALNE